MVGVEESHGDYACPNICPRNDWSILNEHMEEKHSYNPAHGGMIHFRTTRERAKISCVVTGGVDIRKNLKKDMFKI